MKIFKNTIEKINEKTIEVKSCEEAQDNSSLTAELEDVSTDHSSFFDQTTDSSFSYISGMY